jgi:ABC-2 type transport system ATP-binding protein
VKDFPVIECRAVTKSYSSRPILKDINLTIEPGISALLGANGAGKSTLLRLLSGLEAPDSGSLSLLGLTFQDFAVDIKSKLGVVPEGLALFESFTLRENLMAIGPIYGLSQHEAESRTISLLHLLGLHQARNTPARQASFGMRKKTALAMALLHKPSVLLLDEPFEGIDPASSIVIQALLQQLAQQRTTILLTSHILPTVQRIASRVIILHNSRIEADFIPSPASAALEQTYFNTVGAVQPEIPDWLC